MEESNRNILESLIISVVTLNFEEFRQTVLRCQADIRDSVDADCNNIFHELAKSVSREQKVIDFIDLLTSCVISSLVRGPISSNIQASHSPITQLHN
jgi:hypothetical protein